MMLFNGVKSVKIHKSEKSSAIPLAQLRRRRSDRDRAINLEVVSEENLTAADELYAEIGRNYRFFLGWRHASIAGYFFTLFTVAQIWLDLRQADPLDSWLVPFICSPIGFLFWLIDRRTSGLFRSAVTAGRKLEQSAKLEGYFTSQASVGTIPGADPAYPQFSHTKIFTALYATISLVMLLLSYLDYNRSFS